MKQHEPPDVQSFVRECSDLTAAEQIWDQLNSEHAIEDIGETFPGFGAWASSDVRADPMPLLAAYREGHPVALLPAVRQYRSVKGIRLAVLEAAGNDHWKAGCPIVGRDPQESVATLLDGLSHRRDWDMAELGPILEESETLALLMHHGRHLRLSPQISGSIEDPVVRLDGSWDAYYASLSGNLRSQIKRGEARLDGYGPIVFEEYTGGPELESRLEEFYKVEASGWKGREGTAIANDERVRRFYTQLAQEAARRGWLRMYALRVNGHCVAADYGLALGGAVYMLKIGYDARWSHCSPGQVMRKRVLEQLFAAGRDRIYDLRPGGGDHRAYKTRWANQLRRYVILRMFNPRTVRGRLAATANRVRIWLRERKPMPSEAAVPATTA